MSVFFYLYTQKYLCIALLYYVMQHLNIKLNPGMMDDWNKTVVLLSSIAGRRLKNQDALSLLLSIIAGMNQDWSYALQEVVNDIERGE